MGVKAGNFYKILDDYGSTTAYLQQYEYSFDQDENKIHVIEPNEVIQILEVLPPNAWKYNYKVKHGDIVCYITTSQSPATYLLPHHTPEDMLLAIKKLDWI